MHAQKFQLRYSVVEDRVLVIVTGEDGRERMFGLTRRLVKRLIPGLQKILGDDAVEGPPLPFDKPDPRPAAADGSVPPAGAPSGESAPDDRPDPAEAPPAPRPGTHLVTRLRVVEKTKGTHVLHISDADTTLKVPLNDAQLGQFVRGILTVLQRADWGLDWQPDATGETGEPPASETATIDITADSPSRYRH